jgi:hypothetical protein
MTTPDPSGRSGLSEGGWRVTGTVRLIIGLIQGLILAWLIHSVEETRAWPATEPLVYGPLFLVAAYLPAVLLAGTGRLRLITLLIWGAVAAAMLVVLGLSDVTGQVITDGSSPPFLEPPLFPFAAAALFISHHLIAPADRERTLLASYPAYFDTAWMAGVQLALSVGFTLAFLLLLFLGAALFGVIGLSFLSDLLQEAWFTVPILGVAFALAVQLTDVRPGLIRGVRSIALMLLSWLLLVITVLVAGFLAALPVTGMEGLWETGSATALVLAAAGVLVILINTAYQDGQPDNLPPVVLRGAVRVASVLLTPLIVISIWGLSLRIGQHGLTPDRIIAAACVVVCIAYAAGYGFAALIPFARPIPWMKPLERTNIVAAVLTVLTILALFTPLADPARLSVQDQMARLERGAVTPDKFDYAFLRFESGRTGEAALKRLAASSNPEIARRAKEAQTTDNRYDLREETEQRRSLPIIDEWPQGAMLPRGFVTPVPTNDARYNCQVAKECLATTVDLNGDGRDEVLLATNNDVTLFAQSADGVWETHGRYDRLNCLNLPGEQDPRVLMRQGALRPAPSPWPELSFGDAPPSSLEDPARCRRLDDAADR